MAEAKNDFTKGSVSGAITRMALPMTAAQLVNILYNIVDRMYIGRLPGVGRLALTGVGLVLPVISIIIGFAMYRRGLPEWTGDRRKSGVCACQPESS